MKPIAMGYVLSVGRKTFWCRMAVKEPWEYPNMECQIDMSKLSNKERPFLQRGAYMSILKGGTIRFSRKRGWTRKEVAKAKAEATELHKALFGEHNEKIDLFATT
jgi:hypothetical protein